MQQKKLVNLTKHIVRYYPETPGLVPATYLSEGEARVAVYHMPCTPIVTDMHDIPLVRREFGEVTGLPEPQENVIYIVSSMVLAAVKYHRRDVVAPDTGPDSVIRDDEGEIIGVKRFTYDL